MKRIFLKSMAAGALLACSLAQAQPAVEIVVDYPYAGIFKDVHEKIARDFMAKYPQYKVTFRAPTPCQLKQMLENAHIGTPPASADGKVGPGMVVTAVIAGDEMKFLLGSREIASGDLDVYSEKSPLGAAVLGAEIGSTVSYTAPNGREIKVEIKAAEFFA